MKSLFVPQRETVVSLARSKGFLFSHCPRTNEFTLEKTNSRAKLTICCNLMPERRAAKHGNARFRKSEPLRFWCSVSRIGSRFPRIVNVDCRSIMGQLVVQGVSFSNLAAGSCGPMRCANQPLYQGPSTTQLAFAEILTNDVVSIQSASHLEQDGTTCFNCWHNEQASFHSKYGHSPVHTAPQVLVSAVCTNLEQLGVDDDLALLVEQIANRCHKVEHQTWLSDFVCTIPSHSYSPPFAYHIPVCDVVQCSPNDCE